MLKKLIKHEFRATARIMWPIFIGMVLLAVMAKVAAIPLLESGTNFLFSTLSILVLVGFGLGIFALGFAPMVVSAGRFKKGILGNEGYLTMTLPVTSHQILVARLITNAIWYTLSAVLIILIGILMISGYGEGVSENVFLFDINLAEALQAIRDNASVIGNLLLIAVETIINMVMGVSLFTLVVYASYAIGYSAKKYKSLWTVLLIYGLFHLVSWAGVLTLICFGNNAPHWTSFEVGVAGIEGFLLAAFAIMAIMSVAFYFVTNYFITRKLNLE